MANTKTLSQYLSEINTLLENIKTENTNIQAGTYTLFDNMPELVSTLKDDCSQALNLIATLFLSGETREQFDRGESVLDNFAEMGVVEVYNELQRIRIYAINIQGIINSTPNQELISYYSGGGEYSIGLKEFEVNNPENENVSNVVNNYVFTYYTVQDGDTLRIIASRELADPEQFTVIAKINNISDSDLMSGKLLGTKIKIPSQDIANALTSNLVYESNYSDPNKYLHGTDLSEDNTGRLSVSNSGDIGSVDGITNTIAALKRRGKWIDSFGESDAPLLVRIDRFISDYTSVLQEDPRVESVEVDVSSIQYTGEGISFSTKIHMVDGTERIINE